MLRVTHFSIVYEDFNSFYWVVGEAHFSRLLKVLLKKLEELSTIHIAIEEKSNEELPREKKQLSYPGKPSGVNLIKVRNCCRSSSLQ
jgi:hypothetical protein